MTAPSAPTAAPPATLSPSDAAACGYCGRGLKRGTLILDLQNINKSYGDGKLEVPVLFDINLQVDAGEYVAIMGPRAPVSPL